MVVNKVGENGVKSKSWSLLEEGHFSGHLSFLNAQYPFIGDSATILLGEYSLVGLSFKKLSPSSSQSVGL